MRNKTEKTRRLSGTHITIIVVAACLAAAPTAVYAADRMLSVIADPYDASALARVSADGRLGTRGDTTSQQGVPGNEWHAHAILPDWTVAPVLLKDAPPGWGIGVSQMTLQSRSTSSRSWARVFLFATQAAPTGCDRELPADSPVERLYEAAMQVPLSPPREGVYPRATQQFLFPVPLTIAPSSKSSVCLYAGFDPLGHHDLAIDVNGVSGPATPAFVPAQGKDAPPPVNTVEKG